MSTQPGLKNGTESIEKVVDVEGGTKEVLEEVKRNSTSKDFGSSQLLRSFHGIDCRM